MKHILTGIMFIMMLLLNSCATTAGYRKILDTYVGHSSYDLYNAWGQPYNKSIAPNGNLVWIYKKSSSYTTNGYASSNSYYNAYSNSIYGQTNLTYHPPVTYTNWCNTTFEMNYEQIIVNYSFQGNNCVAYE